LLSIRDLDYIGAKRATSLLGLLVLMSVALLFPLRSAQAQEPELIRVPITIHVATEMGYPVVSEEHVLESLRLANRELARFGIHLWVRSVEQMQGGSRLESVTERFHLAGKAERDGSVHVFFVERVELTNPRKGDRRVSGMHWRYHGLTPTIRAREYVAVAHNAPTTTLVHEVGHAFGLNHESETDNLMCSCRRDHEPTFTRKQGRQLRSGARRFLQRSR
jgi:hypothetical protein